MLGVEKQCRLTGVQDLRFLRASHIKPWVDCSSGIERLDGNNGLLLAPNADLLFDRGWITLEKTGRLVVSGSLPDEVRSRIGLGLRRGKKCGAFLDSQLGYLEYHQDKVFERRYRQAVDPLSELASDLQLGLG